MYYYVPSIRSNIEQWTTHLQLPAQQGGNYARIQWKGSILELPAYRNCRQRIWRPTSTQGLRSEQLFDGFLDSCSSVKVDPRIETIHDFVSIKTRLQKRPANRSAPFWSQPRLFWKLALNGTRQADTTAFSNVFVSFLQAINTERRTPLFWNFSQATGLPKHNGKKGREGERLIHMMDPVGVEFSSAKWQRNNHSFAANSYAFIPGRRREFPILIFRVARWRLQKLGFSSLARF